MQQPLKCCVTPTLTGRIRSAYHAAKTCHPDIFLDREQQKTGQERLISINLAYGRP